MDIVPLDRVPNQSLTVRLDGHRFALRLKDANGVMVADVDVDGVRVLSGTRVVAGTPIIPYAYLEAGNFLLLTDADALPDWQEFTVTQSLVYLSAAEIAAAVA